MLGRFQGRFDAQLFARAGGDFDDVARTNLIGRNVQSLGVHQNRVVPDQLASLGTRSAEAHTINNVVETPFQQLEQVFAGRAAQAVGLFVIVRELRFEYAVDAAQLLLLAQLRAIVRGTALALAMLAGRVGALLHRTLGGEALIAFQKQLAAFAAALTAL